MGTWQDEAWVFYDQVNEEIIAETVGVLVSKVERQKETWERLDHLITALPERDRQEFREMLFTLSSNSISTSTEHTRDLVRSWLAINDPGKGYRR